VLSVLLAHHRQFLAFLESRVGNRADAEEILQSAFVRTLERGEAIRDDESAVAWFYRLLRNALNDRWRRLVAERQALDLHARALAEADGTHDAELADVVCACVRGLLPTLRPEYGELIRRVDLGQEPVGAVGTELGLTAGNARVRLHRARNALLREVVRACGTCAEHGCLDCSCSR